jgi:hypothetical protein
MNAEIKKEWVAALRSGEFKQGKRALKDSEGNYCCLGVLCELHRRKFGGEWNGARYLGDDKYLPEEVSDWAGVTDTYEEGNPEAGGNVLSELNDNGTTFEEIADLIEEEL